jgi:hypothetical protein
MRIKKGALFQTEKGRTNLDKILYGSDYTVFYYAGGQPAASLELVMPTWWTLVITISKAAESSFQPRRKIFSGPPKRVNQIKFFTRNLY